MEWAKEGRKYRSRDKRTRKRVTSRGGNKNQARITLSTVIRVRRRRRQFRRKVEADNISLLFFFLLFRSATINCIYRAVNKPRFKSDSLDFMIIAASFDSFRRSKEGRSKFFIIKNIYINNNDTRASRAHIYIYIFIFVTVLLDLYFFKLANRKFHLFNALFPSFFPSFLPFSSSSSSPFSLRTTNDKLRNDVER